MGIAERKHRSASLRRSRSTTVTAGAPGDKVTAAWDHEKCEWKLAIESANGLRIEHSRLTSASPKV